MKILVTGATGFIGRNLISQIRGNGNLQILQTGSKTPQGELIAKTIEADFIVHLAGVNRPKDPSEFYSGNSELTKTIVDTLEENNRGTPIIFASSIHATLDNDFGRSKRAAEEILTKYGEKTGAPVYIFRLTNTFGRWARVGGHSVVANFCYNISHNQQIVISNPAIEIDFLYIDDVTKCFINIIRGIKNEALEKSGEYYKINKMTRISLGDLSELLHHYNDNKHLRNFKNEFERRLYLTFLAYKNNDL